MLRRSAQAAHARIPFYRNVKLLGVIAQVVFVVVLLIGVGLLYWNVTSALQRSRIPSNFSFLSARAGVPISESPIRYSPSDSYARALLVGILNTLRVSLVGVVLASFLGVLVGVMRLSKNWLLRNLSLAYIELLRNIPLAVQLVFWFYAIILPLAPLVSNPVGLPAGGYLSQVGLALPWLYPSYSFARWWPFLGAAVLLCALLVGLRRAYLLRQERLGNIWLWPLIAGAGVALGGLSLAPAPLPAGASVAYLADRGRGTAFIDADGDGTYDRTERAIPYARVQIAIPEAVMQVKSQNLLESRRRLQSTFRFPILKAQEFAEAEVSLEPAAQAEGLRLHFSRFPSSGVIYRDTNSSGGYDRNEELNPEDAGKRGFNSLNVTLRVTDFKRTLTADKSGTFRLPQFEAPASLTAETAANAAAAEASPRTSGPADLFARPAQEETRGSSSPADLFGPSRGGANADTPDDTLAAEVTLLRSRPLVISYPTVPLTSYEGGIQLSAPFLALLLGLVFYHATFIAEIVRGGIQAVPKGQREASQALGLGPRQTFNIVIFPQALRIILPPVLNIHLNLIKNSSLALLITYLDFFAIGRIVGNQTGATVPVVVIIIGGYLLVSLIFSTVLNFVNARFALVER